MIGITSYGAYIPRLRLDRMAIFQAMGWFAPAIVMVAQGERSMCNHDEDALTMAVAAARDCLTGQEKKAIDGAYLCSTTLPFADRQNAGILKTALNLRDDMITADFTSSLRAGTTGLLTALEVAQGGSRKNILVAAADKRETRPAYFYEMWFGDGAAALLVGGQEVIAEFKGAYTVSYDFVDHYRGAQKRYDYMWEERWLREEGYSKFIPEAVDGLFKKLGITMNDVQKVVFPCLFKAEHKAISKKLGATPEKVIDQMHEVCGETGAAHPLVMLVAALEQAKPGDGILLAGFGQGCDALYFKVTEAITKLAPRAGVQGSLENKKTIDNYMKFLKFRGLIEPEMGIRAEAPTQTAMTVLWRKRKMLTGLVGGKCRDCQTAQFPKMDICVNPKCNHVDTQDDYEFADVPARIKTFTGDLLAVSVDPPATYGMVQFEGGGRFMADFTDCELADCKVGLPVKMAFRRRFTDDERGFSGYFWKAVPQRGAAAALPETRFDGRVAIVTGAGAGLGRAYALMLAKRGAKVVVNDFGGARDGAGTGSSSPADRVVAQIRAAGGDAVANYDNVATPAGGEKIVKTAVEFFGKVDILINNAGILRDKSFLKMDPENWNAVLAVHLNGAYNVTRPAFAVMREKGYGRIVMTTSAAGLYGNFGQTNYSAAKMGLVGFMNTLKLEGAKYNIRVNTIAPVAASRLTEDVMPPDMFERMQPDFVAGIVLYLCSETCAESGDIFNAGAGFYSRAAILTGAGAILSDGKTIPTPEEIRDHWEKINSLEGAREIGDANSAVISFMTPLVPKAESTGKAPGTAEKPTDAAAAVGAMDVKGVFAQMPEAFRAEKAASVNVLFQFSISGPGGGDWVVAVKDGACNVEAGKTEKPTTTIKMADEDFLQLIAGKLDGMQAYSSGKLRVEGDIMKSQLIGRLFKFGK
ncbi:MAG: short-chain dehydrogenase [Syntrophobacterales bacterium CG_4_8_14_3_um_filter_58_8]|nr:MAG: short-chain dehydrogenase [Syntrophaceae bacterium CG2_30_58_14]PIV02807.1 MAG: short-chain dehydrogenase [Syntrophobacterales bacterium CG03_land_8_20_14_0_80_58_14]PJC72607.1 MAG: short-chain dehydrogenase [Syntrophobacterales bacterium CG_4_8_14_3_um_filter_58_8]